jgi:Domain of unknown function (DUF955)./Chagasin family peptidase inhibitor I42.
MTTWADAHARAAVLASELHADLGISLDRPVDVFAAVRRSGIVLAFSPLGRVSGLYLPGGLSPGILLHSGHPRTRQRYTAAHELGHHKFGHATEIDHDLESVQRADVDRWPDHEKEAEAFGAWFLMPRRLIRAGLADLGIASPKSPIDVYALSLWLGTSYTATARQLGTTRLATSGDVAAWIRIPPRDVKRALAGSLAPDDLRHDVWWLNERSRTHGVEARPGDRVVLTLDEIPSSGFVWRMLDLPAGVRVLADSAADDWEPALLDRDTSDESDYAGGAHPRSFLLEVEPAHDEIDTQLTFVKDRAWSTNTTPAERFSVSLTIHPPLHGLQVNASDLALTA